MRKDCAFPVRIKFVFEVNMKFCFFDLDGTLTDPALGITNSVMYALKTYGIEETDREKLYPFIGPPLVDSFREYYGFSEEQGYEATERYREYFREKGLYENTVYDGVFSLLKELKESGKKIVLATSKPEEFAIQILKHFDLFRYFDFVCGALMEEKKRSHKEDVLRYAIEVSGASPAESCMVGDRKFDMEAAKSLGLYAVGVLYGYGDREELSRAGADELVSEVSDLKEVLLR
jgi:phosphoglycolate phosphatase